MSTSVLRALRLVGFAFLALLVVGLVASAFLTFREGRELAEARELFVKMGEFQRVHVVVTRRLVLLGPNSDETTRREVHRQIDHLESLAVRPETPVDLRRIHESVDRAATEGREVLLETIVAFQEIGVREDDRQAEILHQLQRDLLAQLQLEIALPLALLAAALLFYPIARRRILAPLEAFGSQLVRVGEGNLAPASTEGVDPLLLPLQHRFNELVARLREYEAQQAAYAGSLEASVRNATRALLEQQRSLARAERLAATGELAASVAHELRNPLAGIRMTLHNLRAEVADEAVVQRLDRVVQEVDRLSRLLNQLLDGARHAPEISADVRLSDLVGDLLALVRHQVPPDVRLENRVPSDLACRLPPDRLRQAILNLVLNAAAALGEKGGHVTVAAAITAPEDGTSGGTNEQLRLEVFDDGPGFPPEALETGVRPFLSTHEHGTGLGLAIVRRFARDLGGEVQLANRAPHGARVTLLLPSRA